MLNDHVLKGAGLLPSWLTGKLSDVPGLIVAPVLLCVLVDARRTVGRVICFFAVMSVFVGQNLSKQVANLLIDVVRVFGLRWTIVTDPSDLWALASLLLAWWLVNEDGVRLRPARPKIERALMFAGACACLATSEPGEQDSFAEFVCGNGRVEAPEECDDGNPVDDDECSNLCEDQSVGAGGSGGRGGAGGSGGA